MSQQPSAGRSGAFERFLKRRYVKPGEARLHRRKIFILPTYYGLVFGATLFIMLLGALNYNNNLAFMLTFLLGGVALIATYHTYRNINRLLLRAGRCNPTFAGQPAHFRLIVDNLNGNPRYAVELIANDGSGTRADIPANSLTALELAVPTTRRGRHALGLVTIQTSYPIGVYRAWSYVDPQASCIVYPRPEGLDRAPPPSQSVGAEQGNQHHGTDDFIGFRDYASGDSPRHIHWKAVARGQPIMTKQFSRPESQELWLDWDMLQGTDTESRLSQLCKWVLDAEDAGCRYGLRLPKQVIEQGNGEDHKHRCLEALALFEDVP